MREELEIRHKEIITAIENGHVKRQICSLPVLNGVERLPTRVNVVDIEAEQLQRESDVSCPQVKNVIYDRGKEKEKKMMLIMMTVLNDDDDDDVSESDRFYI